MESSDYGEFLGVAKRAARMAGRVIMESYDPLGVSFEEKRDGIVTRADREAEDTIRRVIREEFPDHGFFGEEKGGPSRLSGWTWIVDPLCGTKAFARGLRDFAVSIALARDSRIVLGVVHDPVSRETFWALDGGGSFLGKERIRVSGIDSLDRAMVSIERAVFGNDSTRPWAARLASVAGGLRSVANCGLEMANIAAGRVDVLVKVNQKLYDYAAGMLIVREAGGLVTGFDGSVLAVPSSLSDRVCFVASNGVVHREVLALRVDGQPL